MPRKSKVFKTLHSYKVYFLSYSLCWIRHVGNCLFEAPELWVDGLRKCAQNDSVLAMPIVALVSCLTGTTGFAFGPFEC